MPEATTPAQRPRLSRRDEPMEWLWLVLVLLIAGIVLWWWFRRQGDPRADDSGAGNGTVPETAGGDEEWAPGPPSHTATETSARLDAGADPDRSEEPAKDTAELPAVDTTEPPDTAQPDDDSATTEQAAVAGVPAGPYGPGSAPPAEDGSAPEGWAVKGEEDSQRYHTEDSPHYEQTRAEVWFESESAARSAGFTRWDADE